MDISLGKYCISLKHRKLNLFLFVKTCPITDSLETNGDKRMTTQQVPESIQNAVNALLNPFGINATAVLNPPKTENDETRYLTIEAAEKYCGLSRWTFSRAVNAGKLPQIKLSAARSGKLLIDRRDLDKWLSGMKTRKIVSIPAIEKLLTGQKRGEK